LHHQWKHFNQYLFISENQNFETRKVTFKMKPLAYYHVECPVCRALLNSVVPLSGETFCPFCGAFCHITANLTKENEIPKQIIPFATSADDFRQSAQSMLFAGDYTPANISRLISFEVAKGVYLPVYLYEGQFECTWSCRIKAETGDAESRKEAYRPQNGVSKGEYAIVCIACDSTTFDKELAEYVCSLDVKDIDIQPFHPDKLNGCFF